MWTLAFTFVAGRAWGPLFGILGFTLLAAKILASGMGAAIGRGALLALWHGPKQCAAAIVFRRGGCQTACAAQQRAVRGRGGIGWSIFNQLRIMGAEMLNFGALIAFMGVNLAAFMRYYVREDKKKITNFLSAAGGISDLPAAVAQFEPFSEDCRSNLDAEVGIAFGAIKTRGSPRELDRFRVAGGRGLASAQYPAFFRRCQN